MSELREGKKSASGGNKTYIDTRTKKEISREEAVKRVKEGKYPKSHIYRLNGKKFVRDNPDRSKKDNINKA